MHKGRYNKNGKLNVTCKPCNFLAIIQ